MKENLKILIFSDLHFTEHLFDTFDFEKSSKLLQYSLPLLDKLTRKINFEINPDVVIFLGDLIQDNNNHDIDLNRIKLVWRFFKEIKRPLYSLSGNHDLKTMNSREEVEEIMGYSHSTFSVDIKGYHLIFLGTEVDKNIKPEGGGISRTRKISEDDLKWLDNDLEKTKLPSLVFCHYGIAEDTMKGNRQFENCPEDAFIENRVELKRILEKSNKVIGVFSGHQHWNKIILENGINYYLVGSLIENLNKNGIPDGAYMTVSINEKGIEALENHLSIDKKINREEFENYINKRMYQLKNIENER